MTGEPEPFDRALEQDDVTLALTPGQLLLAVIGIWLVLRFLRGLGGRRG